MAFVIEEGVTMTYRGNGSVQEVDCTTEVCADQGRTGTLSTTLGKIYLIRVYWKDVQEGQGVVIRARSNGTFLQGRLMGSQDSSGGSRYLPPSSWPALQ